MPATARKPHSARERALRLAPPVDEELWLLGQPPLADFLAFVEHDALGEDRASLAEEWRAANRYYQELERREAGAANGPRPEELPTALQRLASELSAHARFRRAFDSLPTRVAWVELERLIIFQHHVSHNFVGELAARIGPAPEPEQLFRFCLPLGTPQAAVEIRRISSKRYVFRSPSIDFRYLEAVLFEPAQLAGYESLGPIGGVLGLIVGFGSNFLNAVQIGRRLMLNNGYHRACALRAAGHTHAPCIVQSAATIDDLALVAKSDVMKDPSFYFESARPPLLRDFFEPRLRRLLGVRRRLRQIELRVEVDDYLIDE